MRVAVVACGAIALHVKQIAARRGWDVTIHPLPPELHNRPERIPAAVRAQVTKCYLEADRVLVGYADCGTRGGLDEFERLPGAHCYEFLATPQVFAQFADAEPGTFYLTDFLLRHYERLVVRSLGLDRHPELAGEYFRNYRKLVYLAQTERPEAVERARQIADSLGFSFEYRYTGYGELGTRLRTLVTSQDTLAWQA